MLQISWDYLHWPQSDPTYEEGAVDNAQLGEKQVEASKTRGGVSVSRDLVAAGQGGSTLEVVFVRQGSTKTRVLFHSIAS